MLGLPEGKHNFSENLTHVSGDNGNATYCTIPSSEQLFGIHNFFISKTPMPIGEMFFTYLQGSFSQDVPGLEQAQLRLTMTATLDSGKDFEPGVYTTPLTTFARENLAHINIRYPDGECGRSLQNGMVNEIITDYWFPGMFIQTGQYTFKFEAFIPAEEAEEVRYLFAFKLSQRLVGGRP